MVKTIALWRLPADPNTTLQPVKLEPAPTSLNDASQRLPGGGYSTFRTFGRQRVMRLKDHFDRLEETANLAGKQITLDRARLRRALGHALAHYPDALARVRLILDMEREQGDLYVLVEPLSTPSAEDYARGVRVITRTMQRQNPKAKLTNFIQTASTMRETLPSGINEVVMIGVDGRVLEGLSSNFFAVKDGQVWTAEAGVLSGITRSMVLEAIRGQGIPLRLEGIAAEELPRIEEAFITSASRAVLPVTEINNRVVGDGKPGRMTRLLVDSYRQEVEAALEDVSR